MKRETKNHVLVLNIVSAVNLFSRRRTRPPCLPFYFHGTETHSNRRVRVPKKNRNCCCKVFLSYVLRHLSHNLIFTEVHFTSTFAQLTMMSQSAILNHVFKQVTNRLFRLGVLSSPNRTSVPFPYDEDKFKLPSPEEQELLLQSPEQVRQVGDAMVATRMVTTPKASSQYLSLTTTPKASGEHLRRSASCSSTSSLNSTRSYARNPDVCFFSETDFEECYDDIVPVYRGSKKKLYRPEDKEAVNDAILRLLDPLHLAPLKSNLFRRQPKLSDPTQLRKNAEIVFSEFKKLIKPTIRRLCAESKKFERFLEQRYFWAAYDIVRKRRANHIQSWKNSKRPSSFCYGGQAMYEATHGKLKSNPRKRRRPQNKSKQPECLPRKKHKSRGGGSARHKTNWSPRTKRQLTTT